MVRLSKKTRDRSVSYKRPRLPGKKTASQKAQIKNQQNALDGAAAKSVFIPKIA